MDLDGLIFCEQFPGRLDAHSAGLWRVRVRLVDRPGALAAVAARLAAGGCNLLGLSVLPVRSAPIEEPAAVVDELILAAPAGLTAEELGAMVTSPDARCVGVVSASAGEMVDGPTGALRDAAGVLSGAVHAADAIGRLLAAESIDCAPHRGDAATAVVDDGEGRVQVVVGDTTVTVTRRWAPFTELELARVRALIELLAAAPFRAAEPQQRSSRRQLSALDVQFLNAERPNAATHVGSLTVLDAAGRPGGAVTIGELRRLIGSRLHAIAPLRWRLHTVPLGLDRPYWLDGPVNLMRHVREATLPAPGTDEQLGALVGDLASQPLERGIPLWEAYLIHGLGGGRQALYTKVHHAVVDGVSGAEVLAAVLDLDPRPRPVYRPSAVVAAEAPPSGAEMLGRGVSNAIRGAARAVAGAPALVAHLTDLPGAGSVPLARAFAAATGSPHPLEAQRTALNQRVTARRAVAFTSVPLADVKTVRRALGLTVNDVVMALCATALRRWLAEHQALRADPLIAGVPVSIRTPEQFGTGGNRISFMLVPLPTDVTDPLHRVRVVRDTLCAAKQRHAQTPTGLLDDATAVLPQLLHGLVPRTILAVARHGRPPMNLLVSNVPGPQVPLYAAGARVLSNYPVSLVHDVTGALNVTVMSYDGHLDIGVVACQRSVPDVWAITTHLRDALVELLDLSSTPANTAAASG